MKQQSLCELCERSCGLCSWSAYLVPIKDWKAQRCDVKGNKGRMIESYIVLSCPYFEPPSPRKSIFQGINYSRPGYR